MVISSMIQQLNSNLRKQRLPTIIHLEHELYLLVCMILLCIGTLRSLYKESSFTATTTTVNGGGFGGSHRWYLLPQIDGDSQFIVLVFIILSRHLLLRLFCTWDPSTHVSPSIIGCLSHFVQSTYHNSNTTTGTGSSGGGGSYHGGQSFDRPPPPIQLAIVMQKNTNPPSLLSSGSSGGGVGGGYGERTLTGGGGGGGNTSHHHHHHSNSNNVSTLSAGGSGSAMSLSSSAISAPSATDRMIHLTGGLIETRSSSSYETTTNMSYVVWSHLLPSFLVYTIQIPRKFIWFPFTRYILGGTPQFHLLNSKMYISCNNDDDEDNEDDDYDYDTSNVRNRRRGLRHKNNNSNSTDQTSIVRYMYRKIKSIYQYMIQFLFLHGPSIQFILSTKLCNDIFWQCFFLYYSGTTTANNINNNKINYDVARLRQYVHQNLYINTHDVKKMLEIAERESASMIGSYTPQIKPSWSDTMYVLLGFGTLYCLLFFTRIIFPFPDLLSNGSSVGNDYNVRTTNNATGPPTNNNSTTGSGSKKGHHHQSHHQHHHRQSNTNVGGWFSNLSIRWKDWFSNRTKSPTSGNITSWIGRQYSALTKNRSCVCMLVVFGRVLENIIIVGILPRTQLACRFIGHCTSGLSFLELSRILYPGGLSTPYRWDGLESIESMESDPFSAFWTLLAVFIVSMVLLLAQTLVLNRSYLSTSAYHSLEWEIVSKETKKSQRQSDYSDLPWISSPHHQSSPDVWDVRRKYIKGEVVYYPDWFGALYRARVNSPDGHPKSNHFRAFYEALLLELGHPATSRILASLASIQFVCALFYFLMWTVFILCGHHMNAYGLAWATLSCFIAVHGIMSTTRRAAYTTTSKNGTRRTSPAMQALKKLNDEITKNNC